MKKLKTPLRYPGGKSKAVPQLFRHFPPLMSYDEYREPFIGGGSMAIAVTKQHPNINVWVNDLYWPLYNFWINLRDFGDELSDAIKEIKSNHKAPEQGKELFQICKIELNNKNTTNFEKAINFWILNKCSFSGLTESGSFSESSFQRNFTMASVERLKEYSRLIKKWKITNLSYCELINADAIEAKTFIYLDPPYEINSNLYGHKGNMHKGFDHDEFAEKCNRFDIDMAISYNADKSVKDRFPNWKQIEFDLTYSMRTVGDYMEDQKKRKELLLVNYED